MNTKKIGIIGSAAVAKALAGGFLKEGYSVMLGSRDPMKIAEWSAEGGAAAGTVSEAVAFSDLLVLAVKGSAAVAALSELPGGALDGKIIIDTTNPLADLPPVDGVLQTFTGPNSSLLETLQETYPTVRFVKAFNSVGSHLMYKPALPGGEKPTMFLCGNDEEAVGTVSRILEDFGWEPWNMGRATAARAIEPLCNLWCIPGFLKNEWSHAFRLVKI